MRQALAAHARLSHPPVTVGWGLGQPALQELRLYPEEAVVKQHLAQFVGMETKGTFITLGHHLI
jgi:hypothetical protein